MSKIKTWVCSKIRVFVYSKFFVFVLGGCIFGSSVICWYDGKAFASDYLGFNSHGIVVSAEVQVTPQGESIGNADGDTAETPSLEEIVDRIYSLESSRGRNNYSKCEAIGKYNRYGYGIYDGKYLCFEKDGDTKAVREWFAEKLKNGLSLESSVCGYNTGKFVEQCDYLTDFLAT